jgi:hypothetical protein
MTDRFGHALSEARRALSFNPRGDEIQKWQEELARLLQLGLASNGGRANS